MANKSIYRKWHDYDGDGSENHLRIYPNGHMVQISFFEDSIYHKRVQIVHTTTLNPLRTDVFIKRKQKSNRTQFLRARSRAL